jgi:hypothetical protein
MRPTNDRLRFQTSRPAPSLPHQAPASAQRTQASHDVGTKKSLALDPLEDAIDGIAGVQGPPGKAWCRPKQVLCAVRKSKTRRQHGVIDACAVALRFAAATLSRDTLRSGPFTVGRAEAREMPIRPSTIPIQVAARAVMPMMRTNHEQERNMARRPRPRRPPSFSARGFGPKIGSF